MFLPHAGEEAGHIDERHQRDVERVAETNESRPLGRCVDIEGSRERRRLIPDDADRVSIESCEPDDQIRSEVLVHLIELPVVDDRLDDADHVVRLVWRVRNDGGEQLVLAVGSVERREERSDFHVVLRQEREQVADLFHRRPVVGYDEVGHT